jgi:hypothetical protein
MSWIEKFKNDLIIRTGDGNEFKVLWKNATRGKEFNVARFEFQEVDGTLVKRFRPKGMEYNIEFYFQGEFHLDDAESFDKSADDPRAWVLSHPLYKSITVQPLRLDYENTTMNFTKVTGTVVETITEDRPKTSSNPVDKIAVDKQLMDETFNASFAEQVVPNTADKADMTATNKTVYDIGKKRVKLTVDAEEYFNAFRNANVAITNATAEPLDAIAQLQNVINTPARFADSTQNRLATLKLQFEALLSSAATITLSSTKRLFEHSLAANLGAMILTTSTPQDGDYRNRNDVLDVITTVLDAYNDFISAVDSLQTDNGGELESYIPDPVGMTALNNLVDFAISNLFNIAINGRQERTLILEEDSNPMNLAHRFYGLDAADESLTEFIEQNQIGINEMLIVRKGRKVIYYV